MDILRIQHTFMKADLSEGKSHSAKMLINHLNVLLGPPERIYQRHQFPKYLL